MCCAYWSFWTLRCYNSYKFCRLKGCEHAKLAEQSAPLLASPCARCSPARGASGGEASCAKADCWVSAKETACIALSVLDIKWPQSTDDATTICCNHVRTQWAKMPLGIIQTQNEPNIYCSNNAHATTINGAWKHSMRDVWHTVLT